MVISTPLHAIVAYCCGDNSKFNISVRLELCVALEIMKLNYNMILNIYLIVIDFFILDFFIFFV